MIAGSVTSSVSLPVVKFRHDTIEAMSNNMINVFFIEVVFIFLKDKKKVVAHYNILAKMPYLYSKQPNPFITNEAFDLYSGDCHGAGSMLTP